MVLGLKTKKAGPSIKVDYLINLQGIRPWPPSDSLKSVRSLLLHWENGDRSSGHLTCDVVDGKVESKEFCKLPVTLRKESSKKGGQERFLKNLLEFTIYEDRQDKGAKGQPIGSAVINLADYGIIKSTACLSCPISLKKSFKNALPSVLIVVVKPYDVENVLLEGDPNQDRTESTGVGNKEGNDGDSEFASFTDDDIGDDNDDLSSLSSKDCLSVASEHAKDPTTQYDKSEEGSTSVITGSLYSESASSNIHNVNQTSIITSPNLKGNDCSISGGNISDVSASTVTSGVTQEMPMLNDAVEDAVQDPNNDIGALDERQAFHEKMKDEEEAVRDQNNDVAVETKNYVADGKLSQPDRQRTTDKARLRSYTSSLNVPSTMLQGVTRRDKMKHLKSVQIHYDSIEDNRPSLDNVIVQEKPKMVGALAKDKKDNEHARIGLDHENPCQIRDSRTQSHVVRDSSSFSVASERHKIIDEQSHLSNVVIQDFKMETSSEIAKWQEKVALLEEELMETAVVEVGIYSVVAEHGSSTNKVLAPARRLSRFYLHACQSRTLTKRIGAARAITCGLFSVSKACANDVPRLTFWLSNAIVLRATVSLSLRKSEKTPNGKSSNASSGGTVEEHQTFEAALEHFEAWIFSRIVESIWWQTLTPHMQCTAVSGLSSKKSHKWNRLGIQEGEKLAIELWKRAFRDACERLCPVRAGGHECGCLALLPRLVMEQLVVRLDVAMFNAILRESVEDMPTDPISDPISDLRVLPISTGKLSFGAGVNVKNAVGSWSRWLTDLFGIDDNEHLEKEELGADSKLFDSSFKPFHLLNALSDLLMLPFELLTDKTTRKEVCPTFGSALIKRVLSQFSSDEFNPNPMCDMVIDALVSEELDGNEEEMGSLFPCSAAPIVYSAPSTDSLAHLIGSLTNQTVPCGSLLIKKSYTSDDELDELDSPMSPVLFDKSRSSDPHTESNWRRTNRYQLLRQVWKGKELQ